MEALLQVRDLTVRYSPDHEAQTPAVNGVSFGIAPGEVVGVLGESGCGKTTLALSLLRLLPPAGRITSGSVRFRDHDLLGLDERQLERIRGAEISIVFQEPGIALHPTMRVGDQVSEVIRAHSNWSRQRCREEAESVLLEVDLTDLGRMYRAFPHELSGGQRQRVLIAQALACRPSIVVADEPTAALDPTVQIEILTLLDKLSHRFGMAVLLISHDPAVLRRLVTRIMVMYAGSIVEQGSVSQVFSSPLHPYTQALMKCISEPRRFRQGGPRRALITARAGSAS